MKNDSDLTDVTSELRLEDLAVLRGAGLVLSASGPNGPKLVGTCFARFFE
jgi:hypothetical protein